MKLIDKDKVVEELLRRRKKIPRVEEDKRLRAVYGAEAFLLTELLEYIEGLQVIDVEEQLSKYKSFVQFVANNLIIDSLDNIKIANNIPMDDKVKAVKKAFEEALKRE